MKNVLNVSWTIMLVRPQEETLKLNNTNTAGFNNESKTKHARLHAVLRSQQHTGRSAQVLSMINHTKLLNLWFYLNRNKVAALPIWFAVKREEIVTKRLCLYLRPIF